MAKIVLHADSYPVGTDLRDLFPSSAPNPILVTEIGSTGRHYWNYFPSAAPFDYPLLVEETTEFEVLIMSDLSKAEQGVTTIQKKMGLTFTGFSGFNINDFLQVGVKFVDPTNVYFLHNSFDAITKDVDPPGIADSDSAAFRLSFSNSDTIKMKAWGSSLGGLEAAEPLSYQYEATSPYAVTPRALRPSIGGANGIGENPIAYTTISIGTNGDSAPFPDPAQVVTAPTGLTVSNITTTSADVDWT